MPAALQVKPRRLSSLMFSCETAIEPWSHEFKSCAKLFPIEDEWVFPPGRFCRAEAVKKSPSGRFCRAATKRARVQRATMATQSVTVTSLIAPLNAALLVAARPVLPHAPLFTFFHSFTATARIQRRPRRLNNNAELIASSNSFVLFVCLV